MKKYLFFTVIAVIVLSSCSQKQKTQQQKTQEAVESYVKSKIAEGNTYEAIAFQKMDSMKIRDSKLYTDLKAEQTKLESTGTIKEQRLKMIEKTGIDQQQQDEYNRLKEELNERDSKLSKIKDKLRSLEDKGDEYIYSISHQYKARKDDTNEVLTYDEVFYVDRNGNVIEDIYIF